MHLIIALLAQYLLLEHSFFCEVHSLSNLTYPLGMSIPRTFVLQQCPVHYRSPAKKYSNILAHPCPVFAPMARVWILGWFPLVHSLRGSLVRTHQRRKAELLSSVLFV